MAISAGAIVRTVGSWLTREETRVTKDLPVDEKSAQAKHGESLSFGWGALDEVERQQVRKAGVELMKYQSVNRGY